jgi:hypothetical protein
MNKEYDYYERKVRDLMVENSVLREQLANSSRNHSSIHPQALLGTQYFTSRTEFPKRKTRKVGL